MKVLLVNGSSREKGCTNRALQEIEKTLRKENIESEHFFIGNNPISDCIACAKCKELGKCVFDDCVNQLVEKAKSCDGFIFGSPVYYAHPSGRLLSVMDRAFYSGGAHFKKKPAAAIVSARRAGTTASMDIINKHFSISEMPIISGNYWNAVHGNEPEETAQDEEGLATMRSIAMNMAWILKCIELGKKNGITAPINEKLRTNFIR